MSHLINNKKHLLLREPRIRNKKPPEVKQTLTSKYRMLKANPLLMYQLDKVNLQNYDINKERFLSKKPPQTLANVLTINSIKSQSVKELLNHQPISDHRKIVKVEMYSKPKSNFCLNQSKIDFKCGHFLSSTAVKDKKNPVKTDLKKPTATTGSINKKQGLVTKMKEPVRRPSSSERLNKKKSDFKERQCNPNFKGAVGEIRSVEHFKCNSVKYQDPLSTEGNRSRPINLKTPSAYVETSVSRSFFNTPKADEMLNNLDYWLKSRGRSLGDYHHLKCFGIHNHNGKSSNMVNVENKENVNSQLILDDSSERIRRLESVAHEALRDLHKLILHGYAAKQCEIWLKLIKEKCRQVVEEPQYWECRAALERSKGNVNLAVEYYKTAIVQGAEVKSVEKSLDQLLQKFSLLNIDRDMKSDENEDGTKIVEDARNVFISSIIRFAVLERTRKKTNNEGAVVEKRLFVTPVRRSTRLSRSRFKSTSGIKIYSSLQDAESSTTEKIKFQFNKAMKD